MPNNPLISPILKILNSTEQAIKEYDLIQQLENEGLDFQVSGLSNEVALFRKHFLVMNALYNLQIELLEDSLSLSIEPLNIKINYFSDEIKSSDITDQADFKVREYYLDWNNYKGTSQQDVEELLKGFWKQYFAVDKKVEALKVLGVSSEVSLDHIKQAYRKLVAQHHPDKGGSHQRFVEIREAYELLKCCF